MMYKKTFLFYILLIVFTLHIHANKNDLKPNDGYLFKVKIKNLSDSILYFGDYYANSQYLLDSSFLNDDGVFIFKKDALIPSGMYFFTTPKGKFFEVFIRPDKEDLKFEIEFDEKNFIKTFSIKGSPENQSFYEYKKLLDSLHNNAYQIDTLLNLGMISKDKAMAEKERINRILESFKLSFVENNPDHSVSKIAHSLQKIRFPKEPKDEKGNAVDSLTYYRIHYFDNMLFDWDGLARTPSNIFYNNFHFYFDTLLYGLPPSLINHYVDAFLEKTYNNKEIFKYAIWYLTQKYSKSNILGHDIIYIHIVEKYYNDDISWLSTSSIEEEKKKALKLKNLLMGETAPELITKSINGEWVSLHSIPSDFTILAFWGPNCEHCQTEILSLYRYYIDNKEKYNIEVYAVNADLSSSIEWEQFIKKHELNLWINTSGKESNIDWEVVYDIYKTPMFFLLDKNKKILGKNLTLESVQRIIKDVSEGKKLF